MYRLHIANKNYSSWSLRPWILLKQHNIAFEEILTPFSGGEGQNTFEEFCPSGLVPCLKHHDLTIWDSLAICEYIAEQHSGCWPTDTTARAWARSASCEMHSGFFALRNLCAMNIGLRIDISPIADALQNDIARLNTIWETGVSQFGGPFLAGSEFTVVDAFYVPVAFRVQTYQLPLSTVSQRYMTTLLDLPQVNAWQQAALEEPWREPAHEEECRKAGHIVQDLRG